MNSDTLLALVPLPQVAQFALLDTHDPALSSTLSCSPYLDPAAALRLATTKGVAAPIAVWNAIRVLDDNELLDEHIKNGSTARAASAARNRNAPEEALSLAMRSSVPEVRLAALINPSTPLDTRRTACTPEALASLVEVGSSLGQSVIRAAEVVLNNPHLAETPSKWCHEIRRALVCAPSTSVEQLLELRSVSTVGLKFLKTHPLYQDPQRSWSQYTVDELLGFENPAADLVALERPDMDLGHAAAMVCRETDVEPQVLVRLLQRFGFAPFVPWTMCRYAGTRTGSAAWSHPSAAVLRSWKASSGAVFNDATQAATLIGSDREIWQMCMSLLPNWKLGYAQLANAAAKLVR